MSLSATNFDASTLSPTSLPFTVKETRAESLPIDPLHRNPLGQRLCGRDAGRLAHQHPEAVAGVDAVPAGEEELVAVRMLRAPIIESEATALGAGEVCGDVVWRVRERTAEVTRLGVVPHQGEGHAGQEPDVFKAREIFGRAR